LLIPRATLGVVRRSSPEKTVQNLKEALVTDADDNPYIDPGDWTPRSVRHQRL